MEKIINDLIESKELLLKLETHHASTTLRYEDLGIEINVKLIPVVEAKKDLEKVDLGQYQDIFDISGALKLVEVVRSDTGEIRSITTERFFTDPNDWLNVLKFGDLVAHYHTGYEKCISRYDWKIDVRERLRLAIDFHPEEIIEFILSQDSDILERIRIRKQW